MINVDKIIFYNEKEIKELIENKEPYVYVDDGMTEVIIKKKDIPDYIVFINRECENTNLKIIDPQRDFETIITTYGEFLNKCNKEVREEIIDRLVKLQTNEEKYKIVKTADEEMWEIASREIDIEEDEETI
ncbi:MAG: hypothetical protein HP028_00330 [Clostridia bacterium]|nr:hypothetical protein [Clostridia bacterium]